MIDRKILEAEKSELECRLKILEDEKIETTRKLALIKELLKILNIYEPVKDPVVEIFQPATFEQE